jgi:hypothetical protein
MLAAVSDGAAIWGPRKANPINLAAAGRPAPRV